MGLAAFNRMRKVQEEAQKVEETLKPVEEVKEEPVKVEEVEQPKEEQVEEPTTRRRARRNQE